MIGSLQAEVRELRTQLERRHAEVSLVISFHFRNALRALPRATMRNPQPPRLVMLLAFRSCSRRSGKFKTSYEMYSCVFP